MGDSEMTLARDYTVGADGRLNLDKFPLTGAYTTYAVHADGTPDYVTDSAASVREAQSPEFAVMMRLPAAPQRIVRADQSGPRSCGSTGAPHGT
ncbi:hypothetical protein GCM10009574_038680 [Streptomyces asiaticus]|uniref:Uncharacterized protein n=2 Tax=Streptomyces rhizosphaericus TaxID=114699 RepID=A0ABP4AMW8_9ACTN